MLNNVTYNDHDPVARHITAGNQAMITSRRNLLAQGVIGAVMTVVGSKIAAADATAPLLKYDIAYSVKAKDSDQLPMVVALHWYGAKPASMLDWLRQLDRPCRIIGLRGPVSIDDGFGWWTEAEEALVGPQLLIEQTVARVTTSIAALNSRYLTIGKPILVGLSHGGDVAASLVMKHPSLTSGAVTIGTRFFPPQNAPRNPNLIPRITAFQGELDQIVTLAQTIDTAAELRSEGVSLDLVVVPKIGHALPDILKRDVRHEISQRCAELVIDRRR